MSDVVLPGDAFSLAAYGDTLLVGAPPNVRRYERRGGVWELVQTIAVPARGPGFGQSLALTADYAVVGAPGGDNDDEPVTGFAGDPLVEVRTFAPAGELYDVFGHAVACDERLVYASFPMVPDGGELHVFERATGASHAVLRGRPDEELGVALARSGPLLLVGAAPMFVKREVPGAAHLYRELREIAHLEGRAASDDFGAAVAIDGQRFAIASRDRVDLYELDGDACRQVGEIAGPASSLALSGERLAVGDHLHADRRGRVSLYRWADRSSIREITGEDFFGIALAFGPNYLACASTKRVRIVGC